MKNKFIIISTIIALALTGLIVEINSNHEYELSELQLANIEALSQSESEGGSGGFEYPNGYPFTTICNVAIGTGGIFNTVQRCKVTVITCQGGGSGCNSKPCPVHG